MNKSSTCHCAQKKKIKFSAEDATFFIRFSKRRFRKLRPWNVKVKAVAHIKIQFIYDGQNSISLKTSKIKLCNFFFDNFKAHMTG